jgi:MFS family permease
MAWIVVAVLMPVALLNYLDRQMLASMKESVMRDIPSIAIEENWGYMLGQFKWVYAVFSLLGGYLADRFSRRSTICTSLFVWSVVTWMTGRVTTYNELLIVRSLMGISEAFYIPAALALIADYHTGHTRSRAIGLHQMAIYCGVILGGFGGYVAEDPNLGWRMAFTSCGIFGMLYALPLMFILRDAASIKGSIEVTKTSAGRAAVELFTNVAFILLVLYFTLPALAGWVIRDWMPAILANEYHISQGRAGVAATLYWQAAAIVGAIIGGALADRWVERNSRGRIFVSAIGMGMIVPAICGIGIAPTIYVAVAFLMLFGVGWGFFDCNNMPILSQIVRPHLRATGYGIMNFLSISGGGLADWGFGILRDRHVPISLIFGVVAGASLVSILFVLLIRPNDQLSAQDQLE